MGRHPIDKELRDRLSKSGVNMTQMAAEIGCKQSWLHKYANGSGHATIDDTIRITAYLLGGKGMSLTDDERKLLKALRTLSAEDRADAVEFFEGHARNVLRLRRKQSNALAGRTTQPTANKARETR